MRKGLLISLLFSVVLLSACGRKGTYSEGYTDGYDIGYAQGLQAAATETSAEIAPPETAGPPVQPEPQNGWIFEEIDGMEAPATLSIRTFGSGGYYFVIDPVEFPVTEEGEFYIIRAQLLANNFYIRLYVRGGSTAEINIPLGEYAIYYAHGSDWYGEEALFGPETAYYWFDDTFLFRKTTKGYTKWSIAASDAELISEADFPQK
ncbi:MAG: hypothetical protein ACI4PH_02320 [Faecousia sp.]